MIKINQRFLTESGYTAIVTEVKSKGAYPVRGKIMIGSHPYDCQWTLEGKFHKDGYMDQFDLLTVYDG